MGTKYLTTKEFCLRYPSTALTAVNKPLITKPTDPHPLSDLAVLNQFKSGPFPPGYPLNQRTFYAPVDNVKDALTYLINSAQKSLVIAMYGFDDEQLAQAIYRKLTDENVFVQLTLDSSQAGGTHEKALLTQTNYPSTSVAVGRSEHGAIMHLKLIIVDGFAVGGGSTNWSLGAETKQDNQLTITTDAYVAAEARARVDAIHAFILNKQARATTDE